MESEFEFPRILTSLS